MRDQQKTRAQLIQELEELRQRIAESESSKTASQTQKRDFFFLLDALPVFVYLQAPDHSIRFANRFFRSLYGEFRGKPCYEVIHGREEPCEECPTFRVFETGEPQAREWTNPTEEQVYQVYEYPYVDDDGSPLVLELAIDITPLKKTQTALKAAEEEKAAILDSMSELVVYQDTDMTIVWANKAAMESLGLPMDEVVGRHCYELWHQRDEPCEGCPVVKAADTGQPHTGEITTPDNRMWLIGGYPVKDTDGEVTGMVEVTLDVTEQVRVERELRQSERRYRSVFEDSPIALWEEDFTDVKARIDELRNDGIDDFEQYFDAHAEVVRECAALVKLVDVNQCALRLYKARDKKDLAEGLPLIFDDESYPVFKDELIAIAAGVTRFDAETTARTLSGEKKHIMLRWSVVRGAEKDLSRVLVSDIDITERKRAEEALQRLMEFNDSIVQNMGEGVIVLEEQGIITFANPGAERLLGYTAEELTGQQWTRIVPADRHAEIEATLHHTHHFELEVVRKDGLRTSVLVSNDPLLEEGLPAGTLWVLTDITDRKRGEKALKEYSGRLEDMVEERTRELRDAQHELIRKQRLAILGELAGGVSHELRNPLATITNAVYFLQMTLSDVDEKTKEYLQLISNQAQNAGKIVSDLLDFSRETVADRQHTPVANLMTPLWDRCPAPHHITITTLLPPDLPTVLIDPQQILQVLENLLTNAYQAMPDGGSLTVEAEAHGDEVHLAVIDTGVGIADEDIPRLFEPLYSTKPRGIGLGLAVSRTLIEANGGRIEVRSKQGKGSTFTLILPTAATED
jgi:PAS domain S-box-containing protein